MYLDTETLPVREAQNDRASQLRCLSEGMMRGIALYPKTCELAFITDDSACAYGTIAAGLGYDAHNWSGLQYRFPVLQEIFEAPQPPHRRWYSRWFGPPLYILRPSPLRNMIWSVFICWHMSREQIAFWLNELAEAQS